MLFSMKRFFLLFLPLMALVSILFYKCSFILLTCLVCLVKKKCFATDERMDNFTPYEVTDNHVTNSTNMHETSSVDLHEHATHRHFYDQWYFINTYTTTSRTIHTPSYLKEYNYTLPKFHSLTSFMYHNNHVCFTSLCSDSQQVVNHFTWMWT